MLLSMLLRPPQSRRRASPSAALALALVLALTSDAIVGPSQAAVVEDKDRFGNVDGRGPLSERAEQLGLSAEDAARLHITSTGTRTPSPTLNFGDFAGGPSASIASIADLARTRMSSGTRTSCFIDTSTS